MQIHMKAFKTVTSSLSPIPWRRVQARQVLAFKAAQALIQTRAVCERIHLQADDRRMA